MFTLVSRKLFQHIPDNCELVRVNGIGDQPITGQIVTDTKITIGQISTSWDVCVIGMSDTVILGLDFLNACNAIVDLAHMTVMLNGQVIQATLKEGSKDQPSSQAFLARNIKVPPNTSMLLTVEVYSPPTDDYIIVPVCNGVPVLISNTMGNGPQCVINVVNDTQQYVKMKRGICLGYAEPIYDVINGSTLKDEAFDIRKVQLPFMKDSDPSKRSETPIPDHLKALYERSVKGLAQDQKFTLRSLLVEFGDVFSKHDLDLGCLTDVTHKIDTKNAPPVKHRMRRTILGFQDAEQEYLKKLLASGAIQPSTSEWASAPVLVRRRDGSVRWCVDLRALSDRTVKDCFPLPIIEDCLDSLQGATTFCTLDLASGYYQIELEESDRTKTAFITRYGLFEHTRMGMGHCNAPATFQRAMQLVLRGLTWNQVLIYLDEVVILGKDFDDCTHNLREALLRFRKYSMKLKPKKCELFRHEVEFL
jgi:hypothetical protein